MLQFARQFSRDEPLTFDWVCRHIGWPLAAPRNIKDLVHLEAVHDVLDLYLWLRWCAFFTRVSLPGFSFWTLTDLTLSLVFRSYRFMDMFPDTAAIRGIQQELDNIIQQGVRNITRLIRASDPNLSDPPEQNAAAAAGSRSRSRGQRSSAGTMEKSLASRLVKDGLLTPDLLKQLQREWSKSLRQEGGGQSLLGEELNNKSIKGKRKNKK